MEGTDKALELCRIIGSPSPRDFRHIVQTKQVTNCPLTIEDVKIMEKIYGPDVYTLKGKTVQRPPPPVVTSDYVKIPRALKEAHKGVILYADNFFIDGVPMMITLSKNLCYGTSRYLPNQEKMDLLGALDAVFSVYNAAGFKIKEFHADPQFECCRVELEKEGIYVNICAAKEHQVNIERYIQVVKERYRVLYHQLPYGMWLRLMVTRGCSHGVLEKVNAFPPSGGVSPVYSPLAIIEGRLLDYHKHCQIPFGSYVQAAVAETPTNTKAERTKDGIFLRVLPNRQAGYEVMDLKTGKPCTRHKVTVCPAPDHVIKRVEALAKRDGMKPHHEPIMKTYVASTTGVEDDSSDEPSSTSESDSGDE